MITSVPTPGAARALFASVLLIASCGLVYELVAGALASYLLGNSVTWFSLVIGIYLSAMGLGSWLSRHVERNLIVRFVEIELAVALIGGFEAPLLYAGFALTPAFRPLLFVVVGLVGMGVGLELPLLMRVLERHAPLKELIARALFLDYIGAFFACVAFPLFFVPQLGLLRTSLVLGIVNAGVALWTTFLFDLPDAVATRLRVLSALAILALCGGLAGASSLETALDQALYTDTVAHAERSDYQRIVLTHDGADTRLFLDGNLQFSSLDEYSYHEALVHPALLSHPDPRRVLILGGGDGMAVREVLRHPSVETVQLVDLDPAMTRLFSGRYAHLNDQALSDPRVQVTNADAMRWIEEDTLLWDAVIIDFPDPNDYSLGKLYTTHFYRMLADRLAPGGAVGIQSTSPFYAAKAYWCVIRTLEASGLVVRPYQTWVPAFGMWGYALASREALPAFRAPPAGVRSLDAATLDTLFVFPPDTLRPDVPVNRLDNQALVALYEDDWREMGAN